MNPIQHVIFTMNAFDDVVQKVHRTYMSLDDTGYRFFAYDVTVNHLRSLTKKRICYLDNSRGVRKMIYPDIIKFIHNHPDIRVVTVSELVTTSLPGAIGITTRAVKDIIDVLDDIGRSMINVEYLDSMNSDAIESLVKQGGPFRGIRHLHIESSVDEFVEIDIPLRYLGVTGRGTFRISHPSPVRYLRLEGGQDTLEVTNVDKLKNIKYLELDGDYERSIVTKSISRRVLANLMHLGITSMSANDLSKSPNLLSLVVDDMRDMDFDVIPLPESILYLGVGTPLYPLIGGSVKVLEVTPLNPPAINISTRILPDTLTILSLHNDSAFKGGDLRSFEDLEVFVCEYHDGIQAINKGDSDISIMNIPVNVPLIETLTNEGIYYTLSMNGIERMDKRELIAVFGILENYRRTVDDSGSLDCFMESLFRVIVD